jgi:hypothetical protein
MKDNYDGKITLITLKKAQIQADSEAEAAHLSQILGFLSVGLEGRSELKFTAKPNGSLVEIDGNINHLIGALCSGSLVSEKGAADLGKQRHDIRCPPKPTSQQLEYVKRMGQKAERDRAEQVTRDAATVPSNDSSGSTSPKKD